MKIKKILVANRGEIAIRVIRACVEMDIETVSVYDTNDKRSLFYRLSDESVFLEGENASETYLDIEKIVDTAKKTKCDAVHPGYGFLSENSDFVTACEDAGLKFIGPRSDTMKAVSNKSEIKKLMEKTGIPLLPSVETDSEKEIRAFARKVGYPVIIKPSFGGGGKGMKVIRKAKEIEPAVSMARNIGKAAFGNASFYVEKYLDSPRHIEVQIVGDHTGDIVDLGERDCSIQRRHQKVIEESPSPVLTEQQRARVCEFAKKAAQAVDYENVGTVEFLFDGDKFYFLEINARIQVEHPVTEMVTGIDLVKEQIRLAAGKRIAISDLRMKCAPNGCAIQSRIYAEDPMNDFEPCPGRILGYRSPGGFGVRVDSGVFMKFTISPFYDSLVSKLTTWGRNREETIARMRRALNEYLIIGICTTLPLYRAISLEPDFVSGNYDTGYLENKKEVLYKMMEEMKHSKKTRDMRLASIFTQNSYMIPVCDANVAYSEFETYYDE